MHAVGPARLGNIQTVIDYELRTFLFHSPFHNHAVSVKFPIRQCPGAQLKHGSAMRLEHPHHGSDIFFDHVLFIKDYMHPRIKPPTQ